MIRAMTSLAVTLAGVAPFLPCPAAHAQGEEFEDVEVFVVFQDTDQDAQIFLIGGSGEPLRSVQVFDDRGRLKLKWKAKNDDRLGHADFLFESPEPSLAELQQAYPPGIYLFAGVTVAGTVLMGDDRLTYRLLDPPQITFPLEGDEGVPTEGLVATWEEVEDAETIRFEIEDEEEEVALKIDLPGDATEFALPNGWLQPGVEYTLDVKAIAANGNQSVADVQFTTAE